MRSGATYNRAPRGWFSFEPAHDTFNPSVLDMSRLNDCPAGVNGRIVADGDDLVFAATGDKVRVWGVSACSPTWLCTKPEMDYLARRLAKMGVNMVRLHVAPYYETTPGIQTDGVHYFISALKRNGIYAVINWYCLACARYQSEWNWQGFTPGDPLFSLHLFYPPLQALYKQWAATLFGTTNQYTGLPLAQDPALAAIELIDEDNYLFYTFDPAKLNPTALPVLERKFGAWCAAKYGSVANAMAAWGDDKKPAFGQDDPDAGRLTLYPASLLGGADWARASRNPRRASDQLRFMIEDTRAFYAGMKAWLKETLGYDGIVIGTNWKTADSRVLDPLDFYANMAVDVTARNTYFGGPHKRGQFFPWNVGDTYVDQSLLRNPEQALVMHMQYAGRPHFITEGGYCMPNRFRTEEQLVMAAYASLQGIDGLFPFTLEPDWNLTMQPWPIQTAATLGQYPAAALMYRRGYVEEGPIVIDEALALDDLYQFKGGAISQPFAHDISRAGEIPADADLKTSSLNAVDPLAFLVGRVRQTIGVAPGTSTMLRTLPQYIDRSACIVRSATGQITLDYSNGVLIVNAPCAQGAAGFLGATGAIALGDMRIVSSNEYGAVILVSLDGAPLATSASMLLQVMSEEQNFNARTEPVRVAFDDNSAPIDAKKITHLGTAPLVVRNLAGTVTLTRSDAERLRVTALDYNGYPVRQHGTADMIELAPRVLYYWISAPDGIWRDGCE